MNSAQSFPGCDAMEQRFHAARPAGGNSGLHSPGKQPFPNFHFNAMLSASFCTGVTEECAKLSKKLPIM
jgi:hypothetical protein